MPATLTRPAPYAAERFDPPAVKPRVDRERGIVHGVRLVGPKSRNGHVYPADVLRRAVPLFDGADVHLGHHYDPLTMQPVEPPVSAKFGRVVSPRFAGDGIHADLRFNPRHPFADGFLWACENDPSFYSFSQLARVRFQPAPDAAGNRVAEAIESVASVDIVCRGGATSSVFESLADLQAKADSVEGISGLDQAAMTVASAVTGPTDLAAFLTTLLDAVPLDMSQKRDAANQLLAFLDGATTAAESYGAAVAAGITTWDDWHRLRHRMTREQRVRVADRLLAAAAGRDRAVAESRATAAGAKYTGTLVGEPLGKPKETVSESVDRYLASREKGGAAPAGKKTISETVDDYLASKEKPPVRLSDGRTLAEVIASWPDPPRR